MHATILPASRVTTVCARGVLLLGLALTVDHACAAGKVYRCGNVFQDQPCMTAPVEAARPAEKPAVRAVPAAAVDRKTTPSPGANDRPADAPRAVVIEARR